MKYIIIIIALLAIFSSSIAQETRSKNLTRENVIKMSIEDLSLLSLEDLMQVMDLLGVSSMEELIDLIINRNIYSASGHDESTMTSPLSSSVLSKEEMRNFGATSIEEALRLIPGIIVRQKTSGNYDVHIRGLDNIPSHDMLLYSENTNTLLMIDGRPMFNYAHGAIVWESLPIGFEDIDRIEVVRGPASALYGPNAVNGVINIITSRTTKQSSLVSGSFQGGNLSTYIADIALRRTFNDKFSGAVTANYQTRDRITDESYFFNLDNLHRRVGEEQVPFSGGFLPFSEYPNLSQLFQNEHYYLISEEDIAKTTFPNSKRARENMGVNAYLQYQINSNSEIIVSSGYQDSHANTSLVGDFPRSIVGRESTTGYVNINAKIANLKLQTNYTGGVQDFATGEYGYKVDMGQINASAEYDLNVNSLLIRPGVSYQSVFYDDSPYLEDGRNSYLNGRKELNTFGLSLRLDYSLFEKLRLVSALRAEKYDNPDDWYASWQFAGVLPINENNTLRAVYSRANRSSFIVNAHSNFTWDRSGRIPPSFVFFQGNPNAKLMSSDMVEIGYRVKPNKKILIDTEIFASINKNFGALSADSSDIVLGMPPKTRVHISYQNNQLVAKQYGASVNIDWIISEKLITRLHGTIQETKIDNFSASNRNDVAKMQLAEATQTLMSGNFDPSKPISSSVQPSDQKDNVKHTNTPSFWGMAGLIYKPNSKWIISSDAYYYTKQTMESINGSFDIDSKCILNSKVGYLPSPKIEFFLNARNLLNNEKYEFGFMDEIGGLYLAGMRIAF
jgi:iron complex outermembrane recepter protein